MNYRPCRRLWLAAAVLTAMIIVPVGSQAQEVTLTREGTPLAQIVAASDAEVSAHRLADLIQQETGAALALQQASVHNSAGPQFVLCTVGSRREVASLLPAWMRTIHVKPDGFALGSELGNGGQVAVVGGDAAGLRFGIGELWNYHIRLDGQTATVDSHLHVVSAPAFPRRILWNWDFLTNWDEDLHRIHQTKVIDPGGTLVPYAIAPDGFNRQFKRVIDYAADHKLNGLIIWGFVSDAHGGVPAAQEVSRYAKEQSVRVLPGVGTVIYGGFYHSGKSPYSITHWLAEHPEVRRMVGANGKPMDAPCPSDPHLKPWLEAGARWFFTTFKDIGGVNLEHGDFFACQCDVCKAERAKPENDHKFYWDMMTTQVPVVKVAHSIRPDLWLTFSPYDGYDKAMMADPPKFLRQYPGYVVVQWTYSGMAADPKRWPADLRPPAGARHSIGLLHQGSYWFGPAQWWGSPGQTYALIADVIQRTCARAFQDRSEGLEIVGQVGTASPQNELNYLAFEEFTWNPHQTLDGWITQRLPAIYGGAALARRFYDLTADPTTDPARIEAARDEANRTAEQLRDPRQARRWRQLATELGRRLALARAGKTKPYGPVAGSLEDAKDLSVPW